jgi:tetratricopeptide (TPR) repeat protein
LAKRIDQLASDLESAKSSISQLRSGEERVEEGKALALDNRHAFHAIMEEEKATDPEAYAKSQEYYERGLKELAQGGEPGALEELISAHPESNRASCAAMQLSAHYMKNGRLDEAEHYLDFATEFGAGAMFKDGVEVYPQSLFYMGLLARKRGDPELAKTYWKTALENHPYALMHSGRTLEEVISDESAYKQQ